MHIRGFGGHLPQRGCFECAPILVATRDDEPARIGEAPVAPGNSGIVITLVGKIRAQMAGCAIALAPENLQAHPRLVGQRFSISGDVAVIGRPARQNGPHIGRQRLRQALARECRVAPVLSQTRYRLLHCQVHFGCTDNRLQHLLFQCGDSAVPKERLAVSSIQDGGNAPLSVTPRHTLGDRFSIRERAFRIVAGGAGYSSVPRQPAVGEQIASHRHFFGSEWIRFRHGHEGVEPQRNLQPLFTSRGEGYKEKRGQTGSGQIHQTVIS